MAEPAKNRLIVTQDVLEAEVAGLVDSAPETLDTLAELAAALGDDPNFATTTATAIGERAKTSDVNAALAGKADAGAENTATWAGVSGKPATFQPTIGTTASTAKAGNYVPAWSEVTGKPSTFTPATHSHTKADVGLSNVDNTSDANKPVSTAVSTALAGKAASTHTHTPASLGAVARSGSAVTLWSGTAAQYAALAPATKNAAGFVAVIGP